MKNYLRDTISHWDFLFDMINWEAPYFFVFVISTKNIGLVTGTFFKIRTMYKILPIL